MGNSAAWAIGAANSFRAVARETENPTTKTLAEGLTHLAEAIRELDQQIETVSRQTKDPR